MAKGKKMKKFKFSIPKRKKKGFKAPKDKSPI